MAASYPGSVKTFSTKAPGEAIASSHINDLQNEVVAIETQLGVNAGTWQSWTPTVTWNGVEPTTTTVVSARYCNVGKLVMFNIHLEIVRGSGTSTNAIISPPKPIIMAGSASGRTNLHAGVMEGIVCALKSSPAIQIQAQLGTAMSSDGYVIITGFYEVA